MRAKNEGGTSELRVVCVHCQGRSTGTDLTKVKHEPLCPANRWKTEQVVAVPLKKGDDLLDKITSGVRETPRDHLSEAYETAQDVVLQLRRLLIERGESSRRGTAQIDAKTAHEQMEEEMLP